MKKYCEECGKLVDTRIVTRRESYNVCGEFIEVDVQVLICDSCGEEFYCEELDSATLVKAYDEYRERHKLLSPDEIRKIREQYGLSQRSFAKLLNWGDKTIHRYENGAIQDKVHNSLLVFLREPENMRTYLAENEIMLDERQKKRLFEALHQLELSPERCVSKKFVNILSLESPSIENGFKTFDYEKVCAMVLFFAHKCTGLLKVKLLKLLNYSDMIFYQRNGISMSGTKYVHLPYGPVPQNYDIIFGMMAVDHIAHIEVVFENGYEKHQIIPDQAVPEGIFSADEMAVLERIYEKFADFGSAEISNYSHREKGYSATAQGEIISYSYAKDIELN